MALERAMPAGAATPAAVEATPSNSATGHDKSGGWNWRWVTSWDEFFGAEFQSEWRRVFDSAARRSPFQHPSFLNAWMETLGKATDRRPCVGIADGPEGSKALLLAGVAKHRGRFLSRRTLSPLGDSFACYTDPLIAGPPPNRDSLRRLWESARRSSADRCDQALFRFVSGDFIGDHRVEPCGESNPILELAGAANLDDVLARCSQNHRGDVRRRLRRIREAGATTLWRADPVDVNAALDEFDRGFAPAYTSQWDDRPEGNMLRRPGVEAFLRKVVGVGVAEGWCDFTVLRVDDEPIAWHVGLLLDDDLYWLAPTHRDDREHLAPGKVLLALLIEQALERRCNAMHFLTGGHAYKLAWRPTERSQYKIAWHAPTTRGRLLAAYDKMRSRP